MSSEVKFGTSGLRGLVENLAGPQTRRYVSAFLRAIAGRDQLPSTLYLAHDLRESSPQILADCAAAAAEIGIAPVSCGPLPTPALAAYAIDRGAPSIMVTGSHIPNDRNGLKFYTRNGEITKHDEVAILSSLNPSTPGDYGAAIADESEAARRHYRQRYARILPPDALAGQRIGVFEHSSVGRDLLVEILESFGAETLRLGRERPFVAVDTEAFSDAVFTPLAGWMSHYALDAIVSTDGDSDRPLLMDNRARQIRGDVLGLLTAIQLGADVVVTPVTSNSAIESLGVFEAVRRTRVGSPFVIADMEAALANGAQRVVGFEANGGTVLGSNLEVPHFDRLMTRDAVLPLLATLGLAAQQGRSVADAIDAIPLRAALSGRLEAVATDRSGRFLSTLRGDSEAAAFFAPRRILRRAEIDGLQFWLDDGTMIHYRASGNAPELRCFAESDIEAEAQASLAWGLQAARDAL